jgi:hypothetical protein
MREHWDQGNGIQEGSGWGRRRIMNRRWSPSAWR